MTMHKKDLAKLDPPLLFATRLSRNELIDFLKQDQPDKRHLDLENVRAGQALSFFMPQMDPRQSSSPLFKKLPRDEPPPPVESTRPNRPPWDPFAPALHGLAVGPDGIVYANVLVEWDNQAQRPEFSATLRVKPLGKTFAWVHGPLDDVLILAESPAVQSMMLDKPAFPTLDTSVPVVLGRTDRWSAGGQGVVVVIIDIDRLDFHHPDFRDEHGRTRVRQLYELAPDANNEWNIVHSYDATTIDADLCREKPYSVVPLAPRMRRGHGTHVAGIAAGNGRASKGRYAGVAPEAQLVYINIGHGEPGEETASMEAITDAIALGFKTAGKDPCVINLSLGVPVWAWDDTARMDRVIASLLEEDAGRVVVACAGNDGEKYKSLSRPVSASQRLELPFEVPRWTKHSETIVLAYPSTTHFAVLLMDPNGKRVDLSETANGNHGTEFLGGASIKYTYRALGPEMPNWLYITMLPRQSMSVLTSGTWTLQLHELSGGGGDLFATLGLNTRIEWHPKPQNHEALYSIRWPGTAEEVITVGSCIHPSHPPVVSFSSSRGPTNDGREKPDVVAPGTQIQSTNSRPNPNSSDAPMYEGMTGTSMATPHVTGLVALMLQRQPRATASQIRQAILAAAWHPYDKRWDPAFGHGLARIPPGFQKSSHSLTNLLHGQHDSQSSGETHGTVT